MRIKIITAALILSSLSSYGLTVAVSNVVHAYQNEAQRQAYIGRKGETVYNTERGGLTVFDGSTTGGLVMAESGEMRFYVRSGTNSISNFTSLTNVISVATAMFEARRTASGYSPSWNPVIWVESGEYDFGTNIVSTTPCSFRSTKVLNSVSFDSILADESIDYSGDYPGVSFAGTSNFFSYITSDVNFEGISFDGPVVIADAGSYKNCVFKNDLSSTFNSFYGCRFVGVVNGSGASPDASSFKDCFFGEDVSNSFYVNSTYLTIIDGCTLEGTNNFYSASNFIIKNSVIDGTDLLAGAGFSRSGSFRSVEFVNTSGTWDGGTGPTFTFEYCSGISVGVTNKSGFSFIFCSDENGLAIPNS